MNTDKPGPKGLGFIQAAKRRAVPHTVAWTEEADTVTVVVTIPFPRSVWDRLPQHMKESK